MKTIKLVQFKNDPSREFAEGVEKELQNHLQAGNLTKEDFDKVISPALKNDRVVEVNIYENHLGDYNRFCGGPCTALNATDEFGQVKRVRMCRVEPLTTGITVGAETKVYDPYHVAINSPSSGRCIQNKFAAVTLYEKTIEAKEGFTLNTFEVVSLHIYLGQ